MLKCAPMAADPQRPLKTLILELILEVKELKLQLRRMEEDQLRRHQSIMDVIDPNLGEAFDQAETPGDIADPLEEFLRKR